MRIEVLDVVHRLKQHDKYLVYNCFGGIGQKVLANRELGTKCALLCSSYSPIFYYIVVYYYIYVSFQSNLKPMCARRRRAADNREQRVHSMATAFGGRDSPV